MTLRSIAFAAAASALFASAAVAQDAPAAKPHMACRADVAQLCAGVEHGGGRIKQCLMAHADQVSEPCKSAMAQARAAHRAEHQAAPSQ